MVDVETIREYYAAMPDFKLLQTAEEGSALTHEAFIILKKEIKKRGLDTEVINEQEELRIENKKQTIRTNLYKSAKEFENKIWTLALESKQQGMANDTIQRSLVKEGIMPEDAAEIVAALPEATQFLLKDASDTIASENIWLLFLVVILIALACVGATFWGLYFIGAARCISCGVRLSAASKRKARLLEIIEVLQKENDTAQFESVLK
jgi:hypothetical protein